MGLPCIQAPVIKKQHPGGRPSIHTVNLMPAHIPSAVVHMYIPSAWEIHTVKPPDRYSLLACVQLVRSQHCDSQANSTYASAGELFREAQVAAAATAAGDPQPGRDGGLVAAAMSAALRRAWPHTTLQDSCVLFARKFKAGTAKEVNRFFSSCEMLGFNSSCLRI